MLHGDGGRRSLPDWLPVVLKVVGATLAHKTEAGAVRLGLGDREAVIRAAPRYER